MTESLRRKWESILGDWVDPLSEVLASKYMIDLAKFLEEQYKGPISIYPAKDKIFKAFKECPYNEMGVVILGGEPYNNGKATGLAFANERGTHHLSYSRELSVIRSRVGETVYGGIYTHFDPSLNHWARGGVLLLNSMLTSKEGVPAAHETVWKTFIKEVLIAINKYTKGTVFCIWGRIAATFDQYIIDPGRNSNIILRTPYPSSMEWKCDHFVKANDHLRSQNQGKISW